MIYKYQWRDDARFNADPEVIGKRLQLLKAKYGEASPPVIVADAKKKSSPLHKCFDWDVDRAAEAHWLQTARLLAGALVKVQIGKDGVEHITRAFVAMPISGKLEHDYTPLEIVLRNPTQRAMMLEMALRELRSIQHKYEVLEELAVVWAALDGVGMGEMREAS